MNFRPASVGFTNNRSSQMNATTFVVAVQRILAEHPAAAHGACCRELINQKVGGGLLEAIEVDE